MILQYTNTDEHYISLNELVHEISNGLNIPENSSWLKAKLVILAKAGGNEYLIEKERQLTDTAELIMELENSVSMVLSSVFSPDILIESGTTVLLL